MANEEKSLDTSDLQNQLKDTKSRLTAFSKTVGKIFAIPRAINKQGEELDKAMLEFGRKLGDKLGKKLDNKYVVWISLKADKFKTKLKDVKDKIASFSKMAMRMLTIPIRIGKLAVGPIKQFLEIGRDLALFSNRTGIAVESVSTLGGALNEFGGDTEAAKSSLESLQKSIYEAGTFDSGALIDAQSKYNLDIFDDNGQIKDVNALMESLADTMGRLSKPAAQDLGTMLGLDNSVISLLQQGKEGYKNLIDTQSKLSPMTKADAEASKAFSDQMIKFNQSIETLSTSFSRALLPVVEQVNRMLEVLSGWIRGNHDLFSAFAGFISDVLVGAFKAVSDTVERLLFSIPELDEKLSAMKDGFMEILGLFKAGNITEGFAKIGEMITGNILPLFLELDNVFAEIGKILWESIVKYTPQIVDTLLGIAGGFLKGLIVPLIGAKNAEAVGNYIKNFQTNVSAVVQDLFSKSDITKIRTNEMVDMGFFDSDMAKKFKGVKDLNYDDIFENEYQVWFGMQKEANRKAMELRNEALAKAKNVSTLATSGVSNNTNNPTVNNNQRINVTVNSTDEAAKFINGVSLGGNTGLLNYRVGM